ncbi:MAG: 50S ribosomal protein L10 [Acutalibacteraceae bacterium]
MPSQSVLERKQAQVAELVEKMKGATTGVIVDYKGISVADDTKLRKDLREAGVDYRVVKNTLLGRAADECGLGDLKNVLEGTSAIAFSDDYTAAAKILNDYAEGQKDIFTIKAGFCDGEVIDVDAVKKLAKMPSKEGLLSMLCSALQGNISGLARALQAVVDQKNEATPA